MNGSMYQMMKIVSYVKKRIREGTESSLIMPDSNRSIFFEFLEEGFLFAQKNKTAANVQDWYRILQQKNIKTVKMHISVANNDPRMAGFANGEAEGLVTAYGKGAVTYWKPSWSYNQEAHAWDICYKEILWENMRIEYLEQEDDPTDDFKEALKKIETFADEIGFDHYARDFREAYEILCGIKPADYPKWMERDRHLFNPETARLVLAVEKADVFGGMGSWNDSPPYYAHDRGRDEEYDQVTYELYVQSRRAAMYAVNH